jgi:hypothetical protein
MLCLFFVSLISLLFVVEVWPEFTRIFICALFNSYVAVTWLDNGEVLSAGYQVSGGQVVRSTDYGITWSVIGTSDFFSTGLFGIAARKIGRWT